MQTPLIPPVVFSVAAVCITVKGSQEDCDVLYYFTANDQSERHSERAGRASASLSPVPVPVCLPSTESGSRALLSAAEEDGGHRRSCRSPRSPCRVR